MRCFYSFCSNVILLTTVISLSTETIQVNMFFVSITNYHLWTDVRNRIRDVVGSIRN